MKLMSKTEFIKILGSQIVRSSAVTAGSDTNAEESMITGCSSTVAVGTLILVWEEEATDVLVGAT
ncbi:hypothetical protein A2U01_0028080 [Trifolium medium]|uniref:Uncharacterized protein n=1 Tax=Trifolium medium TaxID=97028 RepID=A0A392P4T9_9FABA|nr:hypothetical protein [Trifolium medium]